MRGCFGCLGALIVLALLAWPIEVLAHILGWSDAQTGYLLLAVLGLLALGASAPRTGGASAARPTEAAGRLEAPATRPTRMRLVGRLGGPSNRRTEERVRPRRDASATRAQTLAGHVGGRARDPLPAQLRFQILARDGFRCRYCGRPGSAPGVVLHVDHIVPVAAGGTTSEDNLRAACEECNLGKAARVVVSQSAR